MRRKDGKIYRGYETSDYFRSEMYEFKKAFRTDH